MSVSDSHVRPTGAEWQSPVPDRPAWQTHAACRGAGPDLFYIDRGEPTAEAKAVCAVCPVTAQCLDFALIHHDTFGIWGGMSVRERRRLRRVPPAVPVIGASAICSCCGETFRPARRDQQFCTADCRTYHHRRGAA